MKCRNCGQEINDNAKFCTYCGTQNIQEPAPEAQPAPVQPEMPAQPETPAQPVAPAEPIQPVYAPVPPVQTPTQPQPPVQQPYYQPQVQPAQSPSEDKKPIFKQWWFWTIIAVIVLLVVGIIAFAGSSDKNPDNDVVITTEESENDNSGDEEETEEETEAESEEETEEHDDSYNNYDDGYNYDDNNDFEMTNVMLNEKFTVGELCEITLNNCYWADYLCAEDEDPDFIISDSEPIDGETYIVIEATVKNISGSEISFENLFAEFVVNDKYTYDNSVKILSESSSGGFLSSLVQLTPLQEKTVYIICSIPDEMAESATTVDFIFGADKEFSYEPSWNGKDACDYLYIAEFEVVDE
ncbi:MAG: zinc-ribbon domain-containing protein [Clostridia bacterium]|nr:zinc-ribbon domain-containing protein [Clostridia bacterium]